ncbi:fibronectin type III-like domain-containing protein [Trichoderma breve]|uniref:beta-glucosidase n=1 Tax=Trichoderma breve TaxID=2034170 RepID=A0A9W9E4X6_9HYPO|nr:fibronectin type III-like domain-containing protein [Trichoderma breve]KAJ4856762.1 fibronectin type III-like domain-containing protein [Trichoderma breve]
MTAESYSTANANGLRSPDGRPMQQFLVDTRLSARKKLLALSLEQKVSLLTAADFWRTNAIPEHGIPAIKTSDGPNGARGAMFIGGTKAALFPCGTSLAATWNKSLLRTIGEHLAAEAKARSADLLLAPTVCMHRHPLGGRNFESFSEDPLLTGKLAAQYIQGLQENGIAASIKHFVGNEVETDRMSRDSIISERALREVYLRPFEIAIREAQPWTVMSSYNLVNGVHADMNYKTLKHILRGEWAYDGTVISDWSGINSTVESVRAGCDIEFPHSTKWRFDKLVEAVNEHRIVERVKPSADMSPERPEQEEDRQETRQLIRTAGHEGLTLLKNDGILPICPKTTKIAVIGPNANRASANGGGSASLNPYYTTLPLDSIRQVAGEVKFAQGCSIHKWLPVASKYCTNSAGNVGVDIDWYAGDRFHGEPVVTQQRNHTDLFLWDSAPIDKVGLEWSAIVKTSLTPTASGKHSISFMSVGPGKLYVDGQLALNLWDWADEGATMFEGSMNYIIDVEMQASKPVQLMVEMTNELRPLAKQKQLGVTHKFGGCRIGFKQQDKGDSIQEAVAIARAADVAIVVVGLDAEWESEGYDRDSMDLSGEQDALIKAVAAANPRTVVVNQSGSPVSMPWVDEVGAIIQAWYQGQEAGNALADVLFGLVCPSGKLPTTFPRRIEDTPAWPTWPGENLRAVYAEGLYVGYKHYDQNRIEPLFPFGHGLSYTKFELSITNTGAVAGAETVQFYVRDESSRFPRPIKELVAFEKVFLEPDQTASVIVNLDKYSVGYYDDSISEWIAEKGAFEVMIGASSADIRHRACIRVDEDFTWLF